jgi:hypothetical protein
VGFIIKKDRKYEEIEDLNKFELEVVCIQINIRNKDVFIVTYYNPPNGKEINKNLFEFIENNYKNYILCGDLNAKHIDFGC